MILDSLRGRLLLWYTALLAIVITVFGALVCYLAWRTRVADVDRRLFARADALAQALQPAAAGTFDLTLPPEQPSDPDDGPYHAIWTETGALIDRSDPSVEIAVPRALGTWTRNLRREAAIRASSGAVIVTGQSLTRIRREIWLLAAQMTGVGAVALACALAGGWWLVGRALMPIERISRTSKAMVEGDFAARIPIERVESDLGQLARALNEAFDRLHASIERQRRFSADASHELRTPLATLSTEVQWALAREREPAEYRRTLDACRRAATRMQSIVERLLALARAEAGAADALANDDRQLPVQLDDLLRQVVRDVQPLADARRITVRIDAAPIAIVGDPDRWLDAITNVVANAVQYNVEGGDIRIGLRGEGDRIEVVVTDTGVGIAAEHLPRVFEPFFRADPARTRENGGAGLGLAVTRAIVRRAGGDVSITSHPNRGTTVTITLST